MAFDDIETMVEVLRNYGLLQFLIWISMKVCEIKF